MPIHWITHRAPPASCLSPSGSTRSIAGKFALGRLLPDEKLVRRASEIKHQDGNAGRVQSIGQWHDAAVHAQLAESLGELSSALRVGFEWYQCRGAFFHNDAHYGARMFGVWCIAGPPAELVFPRAAIRSPIAIGNIVIFDPFEVHGVLAPGRLTYSPDDYQSAEPSVFVGFELDLTPEIAEAFGIEAAVASAVISSQTRVCAVSGAVDSV